MTRSAAAAGAGLAVATALAVGAWWTPVRERTQPAVPPAVVAPQAICPVHQTPGQLVVAAAGAVKVTDLAGRPVVDPAAAKGITAPVRVTAAPGAVLPPGVLVQSGTGASLAPCDQGSASSAVQLVDPAAGDVVLVNPDATDAAVNLTLLTGDGDVTGVGARGLTVRPGEARVVPISVLVGAHTGPVTVVQHASQGRVVMVARTLRGPGGLDHASAQQPTRTASFAGIPTKAAAVKVMIGNPGDERATVDLKALGARGAFVPAGGDQVVVEARSMLLLDLTAAVNREAIGLALTSDQPVVSTVQVVAGPDSTTLPAVEPVQRLRDTAAGPWLQVVNPGTAAARVTVASGGQTRTLTVAPGSSALSQVTVGQEVTVDSTEPVAASVLRTAPGLLTHALRPDAREASPVPARQDPRQR